MQTLEKREAEWRWGEGKRRGGEEQKVQLFSLAMSHSESVDYRREDQPDCETGDSVESFVSSFIYFRNTNSE